MLTQRIVRVMFSGTVLGAVALLLSSCTSPIRQSLKPGAQTHRVSGVIWDSAGHPASLAAVVLTNPDADEIASTQTDLFGHFVLNIKDIKFSLAAVTNHEWAYVPDLRADSSDSRIQLSKKCTSFHGRIELDGPQPSPEIKTIKIGGFDADVYGIFAIKVANDMTFEGCLPSKEYYITFPPGIANRTILTTVPPKEGILRVHAATVKYVTAPPPRAIDALAETRDEMIASVPENTRILGLGESNHGTANYFTERCDLAIALARSHRYSLIMIEAGFGEILPLDAYIKGANIPIHDTLTRLSYWMWRTKSFLAVLDKLRAYNLGVPASEQLSIVGIDMEITSNILSELTRHDNGIFSASDLEMLSRLQDEDGKRWLDFSPADKAAVRRVLAQTAATRDALGLGSLTNRRALAARCILLRLDLWEQSGFWNNSRVRDAGMAQMALELLSLVPSSKATLWAHILHVSREYAVGAPTMGAHLAASLGDSYQVWALLAFEGAARARSTQHNNAVVAHALRRPPDYLVEAVLSRSGQAHDLSVSYWPLLRHGPTRDNWLHGLRLIRQFGARFPDNHEPFELHDLAGFDGIILFKHVEPSIALD